MFATGQFGNNPAVFPVKVHLAMDPFTAETVIRIKDGQSGLVTGAFNAEDHQEGGRFSIKAARE
jgi:hypothetical protein